MNKTENNQSWNVKGLIIGPRLPSTNFQIGDCTIRPLSESEDEYFQKLNPPILKNPLTSKMGAFHLPTQLNINSQHTFSFKINATSQEDALSKSQEKLVGIIVALTLGTGSIRYIAKCLYAHQPDAPDFWSVPSGVGSFFLHDPSELEESDKAIVQKYYTVADNKIVAKCFSYLDKAWRLMDVSTSAPVNNSILLNYFLVIETISNEMAANARRREIKKLEMDKANEVRDFLKNAPEHNDVQLLNLFTKTCNEVEKIDVKYQGLKIKKAGELLNIDAEIIICAVKMNKYRNQELSHPTRDDGTSRPNWLFPLNHGEPNLAETICREYLLHYVEYINSEGENT